jgi:Holliday junction DNA helicase RuvA
MITHLQGELARMDPGGPLVEVDVAGVRYEVLVPLFLWQELRVISDGSATAIDGETARAPIGLHIHYSASANQPVPVLVGFLRRAERDFFRKFTTVEGIGPAKAVKAMNVSVSTIARAIEQEERAVLTRLPGIGARGADKIIATLRGKVVAEAAMHDSGIERPIDPRQAEPRRAAADAVESLVALGYSRGEARRWVGEAVGGDAELTSVEGITLAVLRRQGERKD